MKLGSHSIVVIAAVLTLGFLRLGFWQLGRLHDRRALNAELASRAVAAPVSPSELPTDTAAAHYRKVSLDGTYDYTNEIILTLRSRDGSPGVNIVTPVRLAGTDTALVVVRGWVYSADGMTIGHERWREGPRAVGAGFVETY